MKKIVSPLLLLFCGAFILISCKKENAIEIVPDAIHGTWKLDSIVTTQYVDITHSTTTNVTRNSTYYIMFTPFGDAEVNLTGNKKVQPYIREGNNLVLGTTNYAIQTLTKKELVLYNIITQGPNYQEQTIYMRQ